MTRAKRDFGTIRKRANGRWQAYYVGPDQAFHRAPSTFVAKVDAEAWLAAERRMLQNDDWSPTKSRRAKRVRATEMVGDYAESWLAQRTLKPSTRSLYRRQFDRFLLPAFGEMSLRDISSPVVRAWYSDLCPNQPTQRGQVYSLLRGILATAVVDEILPVNPCRIPGAGVVKRAKPIKPATLDDLERVVEEIPERWRALVLIGAWCGLRFGELIELRRKDLDLEHGFLSVERAVARVEGKVEVGLPKSIAGIRHVALPPHLIPILQNHLKEFVGPRGEALLFTSVGDAEIQLHRQTLARHWARGREAADRKDLRVHDLRHTGAVLAAQSGATLAELMARIGHSTPQAALRYQHAAQGRDAQIAARMSKEAKKWSKRRGDTGGPNLDNHGTEPSVVE